jgi:sialate O-acetylesterase
MKFQHKFHFQSKNMKKYLLNSIRPLAALAAAALLISSAHADVKPNGLFGDGAVLQQKALVPVWGTALDGEKVTVKFQGQEVSTVAKDGRWRVELKPLTAGGPFTMTITGDNTITFTNVLVGEVWLCSGQSNMAFKLNRATNAAVAIAAANDPDLHFLQVPHITKDELQSAVTGDWQTSAPLTASSFSAVAYFFGRDLREHLKVPVGLIDASVGGTPIRPWMSWATLAADPELKPILTDYEASVKAYDPAKAKAQYIQDLKKYEATAKRNEAAGRTPPAKPRKDANPAIRNNRPACLYNAMIAPLQPYALAGVIWYQGESDASRGAQYQKLFPALIRSWRRAWGGGDFPFLFVQIAPYHETKPEIREAQLLTWQRVTNTAMTVITDVGEDRNIHPVQKEPVGHRLALAARALAYDENLEYSGPVYAGMKLVGHRAILNFTHLGGGLMAHDGALRSFTIAGADGSFVAATASIEGDTVVVSAPCVPHPTAVRFGWANTPDVNLFNQAGLPATPFRTDLPGQP